MLCQFRRVDRADPVQPASRLEQLEKIIWRGKQSFIEVGLALEEIRVGQLYKEKYGTFEEYCQIRWGFNSPYGYRLIKASEAALALPEAERPKTERAARKSLGIRKNLLPMGRKIPKRKSVTIEAEFVPVTQDERAERWDQVYLKLRGAKDDEGFLEAIEKLIENWGL